MKTKILLCFLITLLFSQLTKAQPKPAEPTLRMRLQKYVSDNHLYPGGTYIYFDTVSKKPYRFSPKDFIVEDILQPPVVSSVLPSTRGSANNVVGGGNFHLVKDVDSLTDANIGNKNYNTYGTTSAPFAVLNNVSYFSADDGIHGAELWRSDGTAAGTYLLKDVVPGSASSSPYNITASGSVVFFNYRPDDYSSIVELWKTDGTEAGTAKVTDLTSLYYQSPVQMCDVNGMLYLSLSNDNSGDQLWKSDGTADGTQLVKNLNLVNGSNIYYLTSSNGLLFFVARSYGIDLWRSDGTDTGTYMLQNIDLSGYRDIQHLTAYNNKVYFSEKAKDNLYALWVTDGTPENTSYAPGYNNVNVYYSYMPFTIADSVLYCFGYTNTLGIQMYKYDMIDTAAGLQVVKDIISGSESDILSPGSIKAVNSTVYFSYLDLTNIWHLYKTNGTSDSTIELKKFSAKVIPSTLYSANGKLYFTSSDSTSGNEPWVSDGTSGGTVVLADIYPGTVGSNPNNYTASNGKVLFAATSPIYGNELFASDGNNAQLLTEINTSSTSSSNLPYSFYTSPFKDGVLTNAYTYDKGYELWKGGSTDENLIKDFYPGQISSNPRNIIVKGNVAYFIADTASSLAGFVSAGIYKTDGTPEGTINMTPNLTTYIDGFTVMDDGSILYLTGFYSLWKTDGVSPVTLLHNFSNVSDPFNGSSGSFLPFTSVGSTVYFAAADVNDYYNTELWETDGTAAGTVLVKDIYAGSQSSQPSNLSAFNNQLFFSANDASGSGVWKSDGTAAGTVKIKSISAFNFTPSNNSLFFDGYSSDTGIELWKTDGMPEGTVLVKDIYAGPVSSYPYGLTDVNGTLYFSAADSADANELWKSDGTTAGTVLVKDVSLSSTSTYLSSFTAAAGKLFFIKDSKIWTSDGTGEGTGLVTDEGLNDVYAADLIANGNQLFFEGYTQKYGYELWTGDATQAVLPVSLLSFTASLKNTDVIAPWQTATEVNTSYFIVQRSTDGIHFTSAGKVMAKGNSNTLEQYSFNDVNIANLVSAKTIYYRLQTVDNGGSTSLSKVVPVDLKWKDVVMLVHPNPAKDVLKVRINNYAGSAVINLYDLSGKKLNTLQQTVQSGNDMSINVALLQAGVYLIKATINGKTIEQKFVKE